MYAKLADTHKNYNIKTERKSMFNSGPPQTQKNDVMVKMGSYVLL